ncbi:hypothetical protein SAMN04490356_3715 [Streptomyces melanosporofaciens]|uniref:Uncharacterized protein n=1 Tax=Streptomyces melanosporofaciens TaxID=67327 RepID=A0A1H4RL92_STRMJ|nr:hypothetical protein SAMN04490356_3715 [Streptomyces melanosporofaciens]
MTGQRSPPPCPLDLGMRRLTPAVTPTAAYADASSGHQRTAHPGEAGPGSHRTPPEKRKVAGSTPAPATAALIRAKPPPGSSGGGFFVAVVAASPWFRRVACRSDVGADDEELMPTLSVVVWRPRPIQPLPSSVGKLPTRMASLPRASAPPPMAFLPSGQYTVRCCKFGTFSLGRVTSSYPGAPSSVRGSSRETDASGRWGPVVWSSPSCAAHAAPGVRAMVRAAAAMTSLPRVCVHVPSWAPGRDRHREERDQAKRNARPVSTKIARTREA